MIYDIILYILYNYCISISYFQTGFHLYSRVSDSHPVVSRVSLPNKIRESLGIGFFFKCNLFGIGFFYNNIFIVIPILWTIPPKNPRIYHCNAKDEKGFFPPFRNNEVGETTKQGASTAEGRLMRLLVRSQTQRSESSCSLNWKILYVLFATKKCYCFWGNVILTSIFFCWNYSN